MSSTKKILYGIATIAAGASLFLALPAQAASLTDSQLQQVSALLTSFGVDTKTIGVVNDVLKNSGTASSTPDHKGCPVFKVLLHRGDSDEGTGGGVSDLQDYLQKFGYLSASSTGFFGPKTQQALMRFQEDNGVAGGDGSTFGPQSRGAFGKKCGFLLGEGHIGTSTPPWTGSSTPPWGNGSSTPPWGNGSTTPGGQH